MFHNIVGFYDDELLAPSLRLTLEDRPFFGCPIPLIQFIRSYLPYLHTVPSAPWGRSML
jgi:hypothetical protein